MSDKKNAALEYLDWDLAVIPCKGKRPLIRWEEYQQRLPTEEEVEKWWTDWPDANIALITGNVSKVAVIDLDNEAAIRWARDNLSNSRPNAWQKTAKGKHLIYRTNGAPIPNGVRIVDGVDVRGDGGYIIIDPSIHPDTGHKYELHFAPNCNWTDLTTFPADKLPQRTDPQQKPPLHLDPVEDGQRNNTLARIAGRYFNRGLEYSEVMALCKGWNADLDHPLSRQEVERTVHSVWKKDTSQQNQQNQQNQQGQQQSAKISKNQQSQQKISKVSSDHQHFSGNLAAEMRQFVLENQGSFTVSDIDREFGLTSRADKNRRARALSNMVKDLIIKRDARVAGKYHIIQTDLDFISLDQIEEAYFPLDLPLGLTQMVNLPQKCVVVLAGTSNAGKTAILMQILKDNLHQRYPLMYLMSEMGPSEYKQRVKRVLDSGDVNRWAGKVKAASMTTGFDGAIVQYNPNGLTCIDFLEDIGGEYYKLASDIRAIYDALNTGIAIIAIQKHSQAEVGRGGEGTTEKARLYITLDKLAHQPRSTIIALKIHKAKDYPEDNPNGLERHVEIRGGKDITPITDWIYCNKKQREQYISRYEHMIEIGASVPASGENEVIYRFLLDDGSYGNLRQRDYEKWKQSFVNIDVQQILRDLSEWSKNKPFKKKGWFFQLSKLLEKESKSN